MQAPHASSASPGANRQRRTDRGTVTIYDCRSEGKVLPARQLKITTSNINEFLHLLRQEFKVRPNESFVLVTTDRAVLNFDTFKNLKDGSTLYMLLDENQVLPFATEESITYTPHFKTITESGTYEYHASQGYNSLSFALAELIDNALSATVKNTSKREIEIRMVFDESFGKPAIVVVDNGCGMTSKKLNNWAVYKLSKFTRKDSQMPSEHESYVRPDALPRSLNSDLSYFGVGGKQAIFFIGDSVRIFTKTESSPDVHELVLATQDFKNKESNNENVFSGTIKNRKPGDFSHITKKEDLLLRSLISEEKQKKSFTAVVITGLKPESITFIKNKFEALAKQLSHIYHYYIHGVNGRHPTDPSQNSNINIRIMMQEKPPKLPREIKLRDVEDDMQSLYIESSSDTFEFNICIPKSNGTVEGVIRYHPFLYDRETYPKDPSAAQDQTSDEEDDDDNTSSALSKARGKRPIFECFWNGRLIPSTTVSEFEWCSFSKGSSVPAECYSRISGVLFTDDTFKVTQNKLTFMDLELQLKNEDIIFTIVATVNGKKNKKRGDIKREFTKWITDCHKRLDLQVHFIGYKGTVERPEMPSKKQQYPWAVYSAIKWDKKVFKIGQRVKSQKTQPIVYGEVHRFLLYGDYKGQTFASGGYVEIIQEPRELYNTNKTFPISKIDRVSSDEIIMKCIEDDRSKLPEILAVSWPEGNQWPPDAVRPAGSALGPIQVEIQNRKGEAISVMPKVAQGSVPKLSVKLTVAYHGSDKKAQEESFVAQYSSKHGYWFCKYENLKKMGKYTVTLKAQTNETSSPDWLPSHVFRFTITAGEAHRFVLKGTPETVRVGVPFEIPVRIEDAYGHDALPPSQLAPQLKCSGLKLTCKHLNTKTSFRITDVKAEGKLQTPPQSKSFELQVTLVGLKNDTEIMKFNLLPGLPHSLHVTPKENPIEVMNGNPVKFDVEVHDVAGNITANPKQIIGCQIQGFSRNTIDCSKTGVGHFEMLKPVKIIKGQPQTLKVNFDLICPGNILLLNKEMKVLPSTQIVRMELYSRGHDSRVFKNDEKINWPAGGVLENLFYKLYDEGEREVELNAKIASMVKVSWARNVNQKDLMQGMLPDVKVLTKVSENQFHQVTYQDRRVSSSFTVCPLPGKPSRLKATLRQDVVKLGETSENIKLKLVDQFDNLTMTLTPPCVNIMSVEAEGLDKSSVAFVWQEEDRSVAVTGVRFESGTLGPREMCFTYCSFQARIIIKVTPGIPAELKLVSEPPQPLQVLNGYGIPTPFVVLLCDQWGNPSPDAKVVIDLQTSPQGLQVVADGASQRADKDGKVNVVVNRLSGKKGYYELKFQGSFNQKPIAGPSVNLTIIADSSKPESLSVKYDSRAKFPAGGIFPVFIVQVISEDESPIANLDPTKVSMFLRKGASEGSLPGQNDFVMKCSKPLENDRNDSFYFRDKKIPEKVGKYTIQFSLQVNTDQTIFSAQFPVNVVANQPVRLSPDGHILKPVVSHSRDVAHRILVEDMTLVIMDLHGNPAGMNMDGRVFVSIVAEDESDTNIPQFEGKMHRFQINLRDGKAHISRLAIMENSPGENGSSYTLLFQPEIESSTPLEPYKLSFLFYSDVADQQKMCELSRKRDEVSRELKAYEEVFSVSDRVLQLLQNKYKRSLQNETEFRRELSRKSITISEPASIPDINQWIKEKDDEAENIRSMPRRIYREPDPFKVQQDVLGKVGHLATVSDDAAAWVISWQIGSMMNCVVTVTTEAAQKIYRDTKGAQMVMPLDGLYVQQENRPLPHIRNGQNLFEPQGNPVRARSLLTYTEDKKKCETVFKNILGDTIVIDDLDSATFYRREAVRNRIPCPILLTRNGERVTNKGAFGGLQNKAPPMKLMKVFGAPLPQRYHDLTREKDLLIEYQKLVESLETNKKELNDHSSVMSSPENKEKHQNMLQKRNELKELERQLGLLQSKPVRRQLQMDWNTSGIAAKKPKI